MICEECGKDRPLTYRSWQLKKRSVCAWCIRENHPETLPQVGRTVSVSPIWASPVEEPEPEPFEVTDGMVDRAWFAMCRAENLDHRSMGFGKESMRAALEAALNGDGS